MTSKKSSFWQDMLCHIAVSIWLLLQTACVNVADVDWITKVLLVSLDIVLVVYCVHGCFLFCSRPDTTSPKKGTTIRKQSELVSRKTQNGKHDLK